jgi:hypothetical protein
MADAEDLKSSGDFSSCGFDSHPGHHFFVSFEDVMPAAYLLRNRISGRSSFDIRLATLFGTFRRGFHFSL